MSRAGRKPLLINDMYNCFKDLDRQSDEFYDKNELVLIHHDLLHFKATVQALSTSAEYYGNLFDRIDDREGYLSEEVLADEAWLKCLVLSRIEYEALCKEAVEAGFREVEVSCLDPEGYSATRIKTLQ